MSILEQLLTGGLFLAVLGCYVYVAKAVADMKRDQKALEDCVEGALKDNTNALHKLDTTMARFDERLKSMERALTDKKVRGDNAA